MSNWNGVARKEPQFGLLGNIAFLESCGIVGSQLSKLLKRKPSIFVMPEPMLRDVVSQTLRKKLDLFRSFGFCEDECMEMFRRAPSLLRTSEEKLMFGIDFFLDTVKFKKSVFVHKPTCLMSSMENRVIPRYKVLQVIKSKKLLNREPSLIRVLDMTEDEFWRSLYQDIEMTKRNCCLHIRVVFRIPVKRILKQVLHEILKPF
ncbi:hypothetical protein FEM48_Zijuj08G0171800 [Ziziphus jujuba var. spinosa]|uniref:Uncharacterized protein n=1 Tax=Ziziphus jujuba var. spinosa TaxID=714518 RepID=A0A978V0C3_ZIZJJ|nr:hypothetical protein FEM48_Zijuj08G0171800 [Ziziphus jujuba var. spinosa]